MPFPSHGAPARLSTVALALVGSALLAACGATMPLEPEHRARRRLRAGVRPGRGRGGRAAAQADAPAARRRWRSAAAPRAASPTSA